MTHMRDQLTALMRDTCPRCGSCGHRDLCSACLSDLTFEGRHGLEISSDTWPIEGLARFRAQADLAMLRNPVLLPADEDDESIIGREE